MKQKSIGMEIRSLTNLIKRHIENSQHFQDIDGISGVNGWIIAYLYQNENRDVFQRDLEERFSITRSTISRVLKIMEQKGLIERQGVDSDARLKKLVLTKKAKDIYQAIITDLRNVETKLMKGFSQEEKDTLFSYIERMKNNMEIDGR
ncbi:MarR family winged helix-turn-helix transcriptional regulator [Acetivibrio saccincola]|jgi:DNA-binding MarR family transcriptional regulator|uniref:Transcriptional regulator SlyA n=1 Tax=Acetivibrio saccincola TaxID=1677857 RepID=A0A2K9EGT3_9FIRM|nr:MarR family transcriptional regulator [Acetivibrio saccincola]AUG58425.1 Transcriptional regulator SlyA [Acetivibrio saccincola]NLW25878.1 MarR family transcriptional regulator [Acetivibrio saccincola]